MPPTTFIGNHKLRIDAEVDPSPECWTIRLRIDRMAVCRLHWGILRSRHQHEWRRPPEDAWPEGSVPHGDNAVQSPFRPGSDNRHQALVLQLPRGTKAGSLVFALHWPDSDDWDNNRGANFHIPLGPAAEKEGNAQATALADEIIERETGPHGWTLMHRFNLAHDTIDRTLHRPEGWALLFVWLRFSALRQLDWQRNYNTKPRELSHAQDRLTLRLARAFAEEPEARHWIRLILTCLGPGGDGQRIRDEILQIMHRHHIKEVSGHFMEEWHQKLHNNATPDDIVICEGYLAFLHSNGDINAWWETLTRGGLNRERLASYDRPITTEPDFVPHLKDALIHDFENYLRLLKSVHSGTDLDSAVSKSAHLLEGEDFERLDFLRANFGHFHHPVAQVIEQLTLLRRNLLGRLEHEHDTGRIRDGLYLDLALEEVFRLMIERAGGHRELGRQIPRVLPAAVENVRLHQNSPELEECQREWEHLGPREPPDKDAALHAKASTDRLSLATANVIDQLYRNLQPLAEMLGDGFEADEWVVRLFAEEVVRGRPEFVLSLLLRHHDSNLRKLARLGSWQVISRAPASGLLEHIESLRDVQARQFDQPTLLLADQVHGDEEPPRNVAAVLTPKTVDLVSHVAVRARNASLLFASCHDPETWESLLKLVGSCLSLSVSPAGDISWTTAAAEPTGIPSAQAMSKPAEPIEIPRPKNSHQPLLPGQLDAGHAGGKSLHLKRLAETLPDWLHTPKFVSLPYGTCEWALELDGNRKTAGTIRELASAPGKDPAEHLAQIRDAVGKLALPKNFADSLLAAMSEAGLPAPDSTDRLLRRICQVWASKWNERAWWSRRARGLEDDDIFMAVLVQEVVPAEYAFVLHTANPFTGNRDELYGEVVTGLGETLVGNYPGRALSFTGSHHSGKTEILAYPAKGISLRGQGLIVRSDSNAEDLPGYAGAGLYDSLLLEPPRESPAVYRDDPLIWDEDFRSHFLHELLRIGRLLEEIFGAPQDIEGAWAGDRFHIVQTRPQVGNLNPA